MMYTKMHSSFVVTVPFPLSPHLHPSLRPLPALHRRHSFKRLIFGTPRSCRYIGGMVLRAGMATLGDGAAADDDGLGEVDSFVGSNPDFSQSSPRRDIESTMNKLSKWLVSALFGLVILWRHDAEALWAAMGAVVNSWLSITLKNILNHQRPASALRSDPGMPSSHAQSIFYAAVFAVLSLMQWPGINFLTGVLGILILMGASYLSWLRVSQQLHSFDQVIVGAVLGSSCSAAWFWLWQSIVLKAFISSLWVRIVLVLGSFTFCTAFLIYVIRHWLVDE